MSKIRRKKASRKVSWDDRIFDLVCNIFLIGFVIVVFYPLYFVLVASFTKPEIVNSGKILLYPEQLSLLGYEMVWNDRQVWIGYANTIFYTVCGTALGTIVTLLAGYALSRPDFLGGKMIMKLFVFTMYFSGGIIPLFLVVRSLGLFNTRAILVILGSVSVYNIIVVRSFMQSSIPEELYEAALIDGCGHGTFFVKVVLPLSKAVIAVIGLYIAVNHWNSYFNAMVLVADENKHPLQLYLRSILSMSSMVSGSAGSSEMLMDPEYVAMLRETGMVMKYSAIVVATVPILCVYPFIQKYFVKGVMIGSVKG